METEKGTKVTLQEGTHYTIAKQHDTYDFGTNGEKGFAVDLQMGAVTSVLASDGSAFFKTIDVMCYLNNTAYASGTSKTVKNDGWLDYTNQGVKLVEGVNASYSRGFATKRKEAPVYGDYYDPDTFRNYTVCAVNGNSSQGFIGGYDDTPADGDGTEEIFWKIFIGAREFGTDKDPITVTVTDTISDSQMFPTYPGKELKDLFLIEAEDAKGNIILPDSATLSGNTFR